MIDKNTSDNILKTAIKNDNNQHAIKWTSDCREKNDTKLGLIQAVAGTAILMLLFSVAGVGTSILEEKENGTINRLLYSPLKGSTILYSKMLFAFFISILQLTAMFLFAWLIFNMDLSVNIPGLILMIIATSFAVSSLGIFLAADCKNTTAGPESEHNYYSCHVGYWRKYDPSVYNACNTSEDCSSKCKLLGNSGIL